MSLSGCASSKAKGLAKLQSARRRTGVRQLLLGSVCPGYGLVRRRRDPSVPSTRRTPKDLEHGTDPTAAMARLLTDRIVRCHLKTMARLGVEYDLLSWEGDIIRLEVLGPCLRAHEGLRNGVPAAGRQARRVLGDARSTTVPPRTRTRGSDDPPDAAVTDETGPADETPAKVIVRSDGTVTYVGKDIAYQLWKFGLLDRDFHYRWFDDAAIRSSLVGHVESSTPHRPRSGDRYPRFGRAGAVYNVIDTRQTYLQLLLVQSSDDDAAPAGGGAVYSLLI